MNWWKRYVNTIKDPDRDPYDRRFRLFVPFGVLTALLWLVVAGVLIWLFVRQFRRTDFRSFCLAAVSVAAWWLSGLFWMWALSGWE